jgi:hypothetical protein
MISISLTPDLAHGGGAVYAVHHDEHHTPETAGGYPRPFGETVRGAEPSFECCDSGEIDDQPSILSEMIRGTKILHSESKGRIA